MKILIVGQMVASKNGLEPLATLLSTRGHGAQAFLAGGKDFGPEDRNLLIDFAGREKPDALIVGMASQLELATEEVAMVAWAKANNVPVFFYADTFGSWNRPWFADFLPGQTVFVVNEDEARKGKIAFPNTSFIATGNPTWDEDFFGVFPSREMVRSELGLEEGDVAILVPFAKSVAVNVLHGNAVIEAAGRAKHAINRNVKVFLTQHDAESYPMDIYADLEKFATIAVRLIPKKTTPTPDLLSGMDMIIGSASGVGGRAIRRRLISVDYFSSLARRRLKESIGTEKWEPCEQGVSMESVSTGHLEDCIIGVRVLASWISMQQAKQKELYPKPEEEGEALRKMVEAIEARFVGR